MFFSKSKAFMILLSMNMDAFCLFCPFWLFETLWTIACQAPLSVGFSGKNTVVSCHAPLQGTFLIQGWKPHLLHILHFQILYHWDTKEAQVWIHWVIKKGSEKTSIFSFNDYSKLHHWPHAPFAFFVKQSQICVLTKDKAKQNKIIAPFSVLISMQIRFAAISFPGFIELLFQFVK